MTDPFEVLFDPLLPVEPDRGFAERLRSRVVQAMQLPKGVTVSNLTLDSETPTAPVRRAINLVPYLAVSGARDAIGWYEDALGARTVGDPYVMEDGSIGHAELKIGDTTLMLSEEHPSIGVVAPVPGAGNSVTLHLLVAEPGEVDQVMADAIDAGAQLERPAADYEYGRNGVVRDPFGHRWLISAEPPEQPTPRAGDAGAAQGEARSESGPRQGDVAYASLHVGDLRRAVSFFEAVLGWRFGPASAPQGRRVEGQSLSLGIWERPGPSTLFLCMAVEDIEAAAARVREAGGTAGEPQHEPYGIVCDCLDDQGVPFALVELPHTDASVATSHHPNGALHGDLAYVTMEVIESGKARAFYGSVLGWRFAPGRIPDGWQVENVSPMAGMSGGNQVATTVPMYRVRDIRSAVAAVRENGGTATEPEEMPYGLSSSCTDDQGTRFYLGQLRS